MHSIFLSAHVIWKKNHCVLKGKTTFQEFLYCHISQKGFPDDSVKNLPAMQETKVWFLGWEDPLDEEMGTHSSILA